MVVIATITVGKVVFIVLASFVLWAALHWGFSNDEV